MYVVSSVFRRKLLLYWVALTVFLWGCVVSFAQEDDPPPEAGRLSAINGNVSVQPAGSQDWGQAYLNLPIGPGDRIYTDAGSRAEIQVGQTYLRISPNSDVTLVDTSPEAITFGVGQGAIDVHAYGLWPNQQLYIQTPSGTATVSQPTDFRTDVYGQDQAAVFTPQNGFIEVSGADGVGATVQAGQSFELSGTNPVYPQWLEPAPPDDLDAWSQSRDQLVARASSYQYISPGMPGGYELDRAGQWTPDTEYGNMWFPNVGPDWAPYREGHWINRDPWGWTWVEDEPWGYAPFHYGRWVNYHNRWGWIPGPRDDHPIWSPALVAFAGGVQVGGAALSVWIPLGPGEPYRPWYPASPRYIDRVNITNIQPSRVVHVQNTYVNITNVNITYVNRTNGATAVSREAFASGRPVQQAVVRVPPQQLQRVQIETRPQVKPAPTAIIARPVTRPVPVKSRPMLINAKGQEVAAQPHARPAPPPVRQAPPPRVLPGRKAMAPPPNAKMTPAAQKAVQERPAAGAKPGANAPNRPEQPNRPGQPEPGNRPGQPNRPAQMNNAPAQPRQPGEPGPGNRLDQPNRPGQPNRPDQLNRPGQQQQQPPPGPGERPKVPTPDQNRPGARPGAPQQPRPGAEPGARPAIPQERPQNQPGQRPNQQGPQDRPQPQARPGERPGQYPPQQRPQPGMEPGQRPGNQPQRPQNRPEQPARPEQRQGPPETRPGARPNPDQHQGLPPNARPNQRPVPPPDQKPDKNRKDEEKKPQPQPQP